MSKKLLICDDDPMFRKMLMKMFVQSGFDVRGAGNGDMAVALLHRSQYDVLITDHQMPGRGGIEVIVYAQCFWPDMKCILVSGTLIDADKLPEGTLFFRKPVPFNDLLTAIG